jgi:hypothetical protein
MFITRQDEIFIARPAANDYHSILSTTDQIKNPFGIDMFTVHNCMLSVKDFSSCVIFPYPSITIIPLVLQFTTSCFLTQSIPTQLSPSGIRSIYLIFFVSTYTTTLYAATASMSSLITATAVAGELIVISPCFSTDFEKNNNVLTGGEL